MAAIPLHACNNSFVNPFHQQTNSSEAIAAAAAAEERYHLLDVVNKGAYGVVYRAWDNTTGQIVAIKHELDGLSESTVREIDILTSLPPHPSIVDFKEAIVDGHGHVLVVMEYLHTDLKKKLMDARTRMPFTLSEVKLMMKQILEGIQFLHENGVMHRDLKPANILINSKAQLKICDFGLSRAFGGASGSYTPGVVTQWYRAPELLLGRKYSSAIDMWSVGCIMAELVLRQVLLPGNSEFHQLYCIYQTLHYAAASSNLQLRRRLAAAARFGGATLLTDSGIDLLERLLELEPEKRITAKDALNHPWFREFYGLHLE